MTNELWSGDSLTDSRGAVILVSAQTINNLSVLRTLPIKGNLRSLLEGQDRRAVEMLQVPLIRRGGRLQASLASSTHRCTEHGSLPRRTVCCVACGPVGEEEEE